MNQVSSGSMLANPTNATVAWVVGGLVVGGGLLWLLTRPKPATTTAPAIVYSYQRVAGDPSAMFMV